MRSNLVSALLVVAFTPLALAGQITLGIAPTFGGLTGDIGESLGAAPGFDMSVHVEAATAIEIGVQIARTAYGIDDVDENVSLLSAGASVRRMFPSATGELYVGGTAGWARQSAGALGINFERSGFFIGPNVGFIVPLGSVGLDIGADVTFNSLGDSEVSNSDGDSATLDDSDASGFRYALRAGLSIPLGGDPR